MQLSGFLLLFWDPCNALRIQYEVNGKAVIHEGAALHRFEFHIRCPSPSPRTSSQFEPDGAYKGHIHTVVPFWGRGKLTYRQQGYNNVHGWYCARVEHIFAQLWQWKVVRNVCQGGEQELHETTRMLLHMEQYVNNRELA